MTGNLHTHTNFSDGTAPPEAYVEEAERLGFSVLGFSDHSPVPFPNTFAIPTGGLPAYVEAVCQIKKRGVQIEKVKNEPERYGDRRNAANQKRKAKGGLQVFLGLEYDYIPGLTEPLAQLRKDHPFDYIIGSVHLVKHHRPDLLWFIDGPQIKTYDKGLREVFGGESKKAITSYWRQLQEMVSIEQPDIIGHLDKIKMHNHDRFFREDDSWYLALAEETLELIQSKHAVIEVNTRGIYKQRSDSLFPGPGLLKKIHSRKIPVTLVSDAHQPEELSLFFSEAKELLRTIGFRSSWLFTVEGWKEAAL